MELTTARWAVVLEGERWELDEAHYLFGSKSDVRVCKTELPPSKERTVLLAREFETLSDGFQVHTLARRIVGLINGILFVEDAGRSPLRADSVYAQADGHWKGVGTYLGPVTATLRMRFRARDTFDVPPHGTWLREAVSDDTVSDVLTLLRDDPDWFQIWNAFERMERDIQDRFGSTPPEIGWPAKRNLNHFRQSAQVYRHSPAKWPQGYNMMKAMPLSEARSFIRELTQVWLKWRCPVAQTK